MSGFNGNCPQIKQSAKGLKVLEQTGGLAVAMVTAKMTVFQIQDFLAI